VGRRAADTEGQRVALTFTDEQDELHAAVRGFLADKSPTGDVRRWIETDEGPPSTRRSVSSSAAPIGSFQAIKHKCADMLLEVEGSRAAVYHAAGAAADHLAGATDGELAIAAALAAGYVSAAYVHAAKETIQIHGGIGYTWEHDAHLYLKRATSSELLLGTSGAHRARLAGMVGIGGGAA
jgi:alkylation response protein AidB-like acyl-CoA dehydrogenase